MNNCTVEEAEVFFLHNKSYEASIGIIQNYSSTSISNRNYIPINLLLSNYDCTLEEHSNNFCNKCYLLFKMSNPFVSIMINKENHNYRSESSPNNKALNPKLRSIIINKIVKIFSKVFSPKQKIILHQAINIFDNYSNIMLITLVNNNDNFYNKLIDEIIISCLNLSSKLHSSRNFNVEIILKYVNTERSLKIQKKDILFWDMEICKVLNYKIDFCTVYEAVKVYIALWKRSIIFKKLIYKQYEQLQYCVCCNKKIEDENIPNCEIDDEVFGKLNNASLNNEFIIEGDFSDDKSNGKFRCNEFINCSDLYNQSKSDGNSTCTDKNNNNINNEIYNSYSQFIRKLTLIESCAHFLSDIFIIHPCSYKFNSFEIASASLYAATIVLMRNEAEQWLKDFSSFLFITQSNKNYYKAPVLTVFAEFLLAEKKFENKLMPKVQIMINYLYNLMLLPENDARKQELKVILSQTNYYDLVKSLNKFIKLDSISMSKKCKYQTCKIAAKYFLMSYQKQNYSIYNKDQFNTSHDLGRFAKEIAKKNHNIVYYFEKKFKLFLIELVNKNRSTHII